MPLGSALYVLSSEDMKNLRQSQTLRCYAYVDRPYQAVRSLLRDRPLEVLHRATNSAVARVNELAGSLSISVAGLELGVEVNLHVRGVHDDEGIAGLFPVTHVNIGWEAARAPSLFPLMSADLAAWPLTSSETQLEIQGDYTPPLGLLGAAIDVAIAHRIAEASVHRFLEDLVEQIRHQLPART